MSVESAALQASETWAVHQGDALAFVQALPDSSVDAIVTDPPYFKIMQEAWDHAWHDRDAFLAWIDFLAEQWARVLKPNGSLYLFASPKHAAHVEVVIGKRFNVLMSIVWDKGSAGAGNRQAKDQMRNYWPASERIVFAEHRGSDNSAKGEAGYLRKCDELRGFIFEPLRAYLANEWQRAGLTARDANDATQTQMAGHWLTPVQWSLPTAKHYATMQARANRGFGGEYLRREYEYLRREYEDLRREYEDLRRPFSVTAEDQFTDLWRFDAPERFESRHVCEKPVRLLEHIIKTSTKPGALVLDCFTGSGSTGHACLNLGRRFVGVELSEHWVDSARRRLAAVQAGATGDVVRQSKQPDGQLELFNV